MSIDKDQIRRRALELIVADGHRVGTRLAQAVGVSRQVANGYLQALVREGLVDAEGTTRARVYALRTLSEVERRYPRKGLQEDLVCASSSRRWSLGSPRTSATSGITRPPK